ncbi:MAG: hypothetical protein HFJ17_05810 [Clostridia bacterium]|nr:hypothetical protein [Clostridia bacterium]
MSNTVFTKSVEDKVIRILQESLNKSLDIKHFLNVFSENLLSSKEIPHSVALLLADGLDSYRHIIEARKYISAIRRTCNLLDEHLTEYGKKYNKKNPKFKFKMEVRRKGVINSIEKMLKYLRQGKPLDLFRDAIGIRIVILGNRRNEPVLQKYAYEIANEIIEFLSKRNFSLCEADKIPTDISLNEGVNIIIPNESAIIPLYRSSVKDYMLYPKSNGYQSLHIIFRARNGSCLEFQIRTQAMDIHSEYDIANHEDYKNSKYSHSFDSETDNVEPQRLYLKLDFSKVDFDGGIELLKNGALYDVIGLTKSIPIYPVTRSF